MENTVQHFLIYIISRQIQEKGRIMMKHEISERTDEILFVSEQQQLSGKTA
jgi:hypothetical protein